MASRVSLTLLSVQNSNRLASSLTAIASFLSVIFTFCNIQGNSQAFPADWTALMTKTELTYQAFSLRFVDFVFVDFIPR